MKIEYDYYDEGREGDIILFIDNTIGKLTKYLGSTDDINIQWKCKILEDPNKTRTTPYTTLYTLPCDNHYITQAFRGITIKELKHNYPEYFI